MRRDVGVTFEHWTNFAAAGGAPVRGIPPSAIERGEINQSLDGSETLTLTLLDEVAAGLNNGDVLRTEDAAGVVREFRVRGWRRTTRLDDVGLREISASGPLLDLLDAGPVRRLEAGVWRFDIGGRYTWNGFLVEIVLPWMALLGQPWWTWASTTLSGGNWQGLVTEFDLIAPPDGWTPLQWLREISQASASVGPPLEWEVQRNGDTEFVLRCWNERGNDRAPVPVAFGRGLLELQETVDSHEGATAIVVQGDTGDGADRPATIGEALWDQSAPLDGDWLELGAAGSSSPDAGPITYDGQFVGNIARRHDGVQTVILASERVTNSSGFVAHRIRLASTTGWTTPALWVQLLEDTDGTRLVEVARPGVRRQARILNAPGLRGEANLLGAPSQISAGWNAIADPSSWPAVGSCTVAQYDLATPATPEGVVAVAVSGTHSSIETSGWPPHAILYPGERLEINVSTSRTVQSLVQADANGLLTIPLDTLSATYSVGQPVAVLRNVSNRPSRPLPETAPNDVPLTPDVAVYARNWMRFTSAASSTAMPPAVGQAQRRGPEIAIQYVPTLNQVNVSAAFVVTNSGGGNNGNWDASSVATDVLANVVTRRLPGVLLIDTTGSPTLAAWNIMQSIVPGTSTVYERVTCSAQITADRKFQVGLIPGAVSATSSIGFQACRWVMWWLGPTMPPWTFSSHANRLFQRAQTELAARSNRIRQLVITARDLSQYAGYDVAADSLVLGARVHLADLGESPRIVGVMFDTQAPENPRVVLDNRDVLLTSLLAGVL
jgi:hypothetical protein